MNSFTKQNFLKISPLKVNFSTHCLIANLNNPFSLAYPLTFNDDTTGAFELPSAQAKTVQLGSFIGDTHKGGSVNCQTLILHPHGDGTHTESAAHIEKGAPLLNELTQPKMSIAAVLLLQTTPLHKTPDTYQGKNHKDDAIFTRSTLQAQLKKLENDFEFTCENHPLTTLVLGREDPQKGGYFSDQALEFITELQINHLLVEEESIDRIEDGGTLSNHRKFFRLAPQKENQLSLQKKENLLTEMIRSPKPFINACHRQNTALALLSMVVPAWQTDAAPSFPTLFSLHKAQNSA